MKTNKKGFTLVEVIAVVGIIAVATVAGFAIYGNVRESVLQSQYKNVKQKIEVAAEKYASKTNVKTVSVERLIEEGYLSADDVSNIYDPKTNNKLNCRIVEVESENGVYKASLTAKGDNEDGSCLQYDDGTSEILVTCYTPEGEKEESTCKFDTWYKGAVTLTPSLDEEKEVNNYRWNSLRGDLSTNEKVIVTTENILNTTYNLMVTYTDGTTTSTTKNVAIDNEKPVVVDVVKDDGWTNQVKELTINANDGSGSGVVKYALTTNSRCDKVTSYQDSPKFTKEAGTYYACVKDKVGNISDSFEVTVKNIDRTGPSPVKLDGNAYFATASSKLNSGYTYYEELTRKIKFADADSGLAKVKYCVTTSSSCTPNVEVKITLNEKDNGVLIPFASASAAQKACAVGIDAAGNESAVYCDGTTFKVDKTNPTVASVTATAYGELTVNNAIDNESGIQKVVCYLGKSNTNYTNTVQATRVGSTNNYKCSFGRLESGVTYYYKVVATNNAGLTATVATSATNFKSDITVADGYNQICKGVEYCNQDYYVKYGDKIFYVYRKTSQGYKAIYNGSLGTSYYLQSNCCNNGHCTYTAGSFEKGVISTSLLNNSFLNSLTNYSNVLVNATWNTGIKTNVTDKNTQAYVGLLDYSEYTSTKSNTKVYSSANGVWFWLINPISIYSYLENVIILYNNGSFTESSQVINTQSGVRPVIVLKSTTKFSSGNGTLSNPYIIKTN